MSEIVIGFDFECAGGIPIKHGFTQLGASAHELDTGKKIGGFNEYASMVGLEWEERCVKEFWEKNPERYAETLEKTMNATLTCAQVVEKFIEWVREMAKDRKCIIVSDNMIYDGGLLKYYSGIDVMYLLGEWTVYFETASYYYGLHSMHKRARITEDSDHLNSKQIALDAVNATKSEPLTWPESKVNHDHHPENDAENMVMKWIFIQNNL